MWSLMEQGKPKIREVHCSVPAAWVTKSWNEWILRHEMFVKLCSKHNMSQEHTELLSVTPNNETHNEFTVHLRETI